MTRNFITCGFTLLLASGCTFNMRAGAGAESARPERNTASSNEREPRRPRTPARPERAEKPDDAAKPREDVKPTLPRPVTVRPEPRPTKPGVEPKPEAKPEPKPEAKPKPDTKPVLTPMPKNKGVPGFVLGAPADLKPGLPDAFWIYKDDHGWHLRTTTDNTKVFHKFTGRIWVTTGTFKDVKATSNERGQDALKITDQRIDVTFDTLGVMDGVDWKLAGNQCIHFELFYDGKPHPNLIRLGANKVSPESHVFMLCGR
jgi:hypothetical protein